MARIELKKEDLEKLESKIGKLKEVAEVEINRILHNESSKDLSKSVQSLINISSKRKGTHAKLGAPFKIELFNLGFLLKSKGGSANKRGSYGYLVFPDEGRGLRNPVKQDFTGRGMEKERPKIVSSLLNVLTRRIEEEL